MASGYLKVNGDKIVNGKGEQVVLRGAAIGGWMKSVFCPTLLTEHSHFGSRLELIILVFPAWRTSSRDTPATSHSTEHQ
jgi:hypothetical protein